MDWPKFTKRLLLADGRISEVETDLIRRAVPDDGLVDLEEAAFLAEVMREATTVHPRFEEFLYDVLERAVLKDGVVSDAEAKWLRKVIFADNFVSPREVRFLTRLQAKAKATGPEFVALVRDCLGAEKTHFHD